MLLLDN